MEYRGGYSEIGTKYNMDCNEWKRKSDLFSFDNLVNICSETVAKSIGQCVAESSDDMPAYAKDLGMQQGATIFGSMMKEFVAALPSDLNQDGDTISSQQCPPLPCGADTATQLNAIENTTDFSVIKETVCSPSDETKNVINSETVLPHSSKAPTTLEIEESTINKQEVNDVIVLPRFVKMGEPTGKMLSRHNSVDVQKTSRVRLSKTGRIEVVDSIADDENSGLHEEQEDILIEDICASPNVPDEENSANKPVPRRTSFTECFHLWRLSWKLKNENQPASWSESVKLRMQRRASGSDFSSNVSSRRNSFSGTYNDLYHLGQNTIWSSMAETLRLNRKSYRNRVPVQTRIASTSNVSLLNASDTKNATRRFSMDER